MTSGRRLTLVLIAACIILGAVPACGCSDYRPITTRLLAVAMAIDAAEGQDGQVEVTLQLVVPDSTSAGSEGKGGGKSGTGAESRDQALVSGTGTTWLTALDSLQTRVGRQPILGHIRLIAFGERMAVRGLLEVMEEMARAPELDKTAYLVLALGLRGRDLLAITPPQGQLSGNFLYSNFLNAVKNPHTVPVRFVDLAIRMWEPGYTFGLPTALVQDKKEQAVAGTAGREGGGSRSTGDTPDITVAGFALLDRDLRVVGSLNQEEATGLLILLGRAANVTLDLPCGPSERAQVRGLSVRSSVRMVTSPDGTFLCTVDLRGEGTVAGTIPPGWKVSAEEFNRLEGETARSVEALAQATLSRLRLNAVDPLGLGSLVFYRYPDLWTKSGWPRLSGKFVLVVKAEVRLYRKGLTT